MDDFELARSLTEIASAIALQRFRRPVELRRKGDGSPVSNADLESEQALCELLAAERPTDDVLSEECGLVGSASSRRWLLDPIDGTASFLAGGRAWGTHVALESNGELVLGLLTRPTENALWWAVRGQGAWRTCITEAEHVALGVKETGPATERVGGLVDPGSIRAAMLARRMEWVYDEISPVVSLLEGRVGAVLDEGGDVWDRAPALLLTAEAGARCLGPAGRASPGDPWVLYALPSLAADLAALLSGVRD